MVMNYIDHTSSGGDQGDAQIAHGWVRLIYPTGKDLGWHFRGGGWRVSEVTLSRRYGPR